MWGLGCVVNELTMREYLAAVAEHGVDAYEVLTERGHHPKVIVAKAKRASAKGYTDYGVSERRAWIEPKGREFLERDA